MTVTTIATELAAMAGFARPCVTGSGSWQLTVSSPVTPYAHINGVDGFPTNGKRSTRRLRGHLT